MLKIGIIYVAWQTEDYVAPSLESWVRARELKPDGDEYVICAVSVPFAGFPNDEPLDLTVNHLSDYLRAGEIDHHITSAEPMTEAQARGAALDYLLTQGVETVIQVDSDEFWRLGEIARTVAYVKANPYLVWFRVCLKNAVFDTQTYLIEPFTPPRIHRVNAGATPFKLTHFTGDNDLAYGAHPQAAFAHVTIPQGVAWVRHLSWLSDRRSEIKVRYQEARGWTSSYRWDETRGLVFNEAYYQRAGLPLPEIARDPS